jgi:hypothetical protein
VSATQSETIDRGVQLRALQLAADHGGLVPGTTRAPTITPASLQEVLEREEREHVKHAAAMTPEWLKERARRAGIVIAPAQAEAPAHAERNVCDACATPCCAHGRCPICEVCEPCDGAGQTPVPIQ